MGLIISEEELRSTLMQIDQATYIYDQWYKSLLRTLICRLPVEEKEISPTAYRECALGKWYYNEAPSRLREYAGFAAIEPLHIRVHQHTKNVFEAIAAGNIVSLADYENMAIAIDHLRIELQTLRHELEESAYRLDPLTRTTSRVGMFSKLREQREFAKRGPQVCTIAMMDVDGFKSINDNFGHEAGDAVLVNVARFLMDHLRPYDTVFRYGGDEFLVCMPNTDLNSAFALEERLREGLERLVVKYQNQTIRITSSAGVSLLDPTVTVEESIARSDRALYAAKAAGRNCAKYWDPTMDRGRAA